MSLLHFGRLARRIEYAEYETGGVRLEVRLPRNVGHLFDKAAVRKGGPLTTWWLFEGEELRPHNPNFDAGADAARDIVRSFAKTLDVLQVNADYHRARWVARHASRDARDAAADRARIVALEARLAEVEGALSIATGGDWDLRPR